VAGKHVIHFDGAISIEGDQKSAEPVKQGDQVVDYRNVSIKGYLSTFQDTTKSDRDGDYVMPGAFKETIPLFLKNPMLLVNHRNTVDSIAGKFTTVREDQKGLYVEAKITDSPAEWAKDVRWKVANEELKTLSMGGIFYYAEDRHGIFKVSLWEGSLTPIPSNPDATFSTRSLTDVEIRKVQSELAA
jgi:HK97 family phage prohead protease